jgi:hypothetical protein
MTVVTVCSLCQYSNPHGRTRCKRCDHPFDAPVAIVRRRLDEELYRSSVLLASLVTANVGLLAAALIAWSLSIPFWLVIFGPLALMAKRHREIWRHSADVFAAQHPELPKATLVSQ